MYLKTLTLKGFKSFADTTTLQLEPGITVVVGPNGSGKSNVVDAVAWVLGAQGPRTLRSTKMDDVIFAGTSSRPALGRAEVSLTIDNSSGQLPLDFAEVTITRTLFRNGASEYAVNQVPCRLLDIQELLSDSGVGRTQHVIVGQGQLDAVLEARPEERRAIIEEAAGVLKYRRRKEKAERRLAATEANLVRLGDLAREVRRQLRPLERQAESARRHGGLVEELREIRLHLAGRELSVLAARQAANDEIRARLGKEQTAGRAELTALDAEVEAAQRSLDAAGAEDLATVLARAERLGERARGLAAVLAERRRGAEHARTAALDQTVVATLESEAGRLRGELDVVEAEVTERSAELVELAGEEATQRAQRSALDDVGSSNAVPEADRSRLAAQARAELAMLGASAERGAAECARARARLAGLEQRAAGLTSEEADLRARRQRVEGDFNRTRAEVDIAGDELARAEVTLAAAQEALRDADAEHHSWTARADALAAAIDGARARAGAERLAGMAEVAGTVLELVDVDPGWEAAFEAAAGAALAAVVVGGGSEGTRRCLERLRSQGAGTILALETSPVVARPICLPAGDLVRDHVRSRRADVGPLLDRLVGTAVCVGGEDADAWRRAFEAAVASPDAVVVTLAGDRFAPDGWRVGSGASGASRRALEEAGERAGAAAALAAGAEERLELARAALERVRAVEAQASRRLQDHAGERRTIDEAFVRVQHQAATTSAEETELRHQLDVLQDTLEEERARLEELEVMLPGLEAEEVAALEHRRALEANARHLNEQVSAAAARRSDAEARLHAVEERHSWLQRRLAEVDARLAGDVAQRQQAQARRLQVDRRLADIERLARCVVASLAQLDDVMVALGERRRLQAEATRVAAERLDHLRRRRSSVEHRLEDAREHGVRASLEAQELTLRSEVAVDSLRRNLDVEPEAVAEAACPPLPEGTTATARARDLERELRLLGPVNPLALEEAAALRERQEFLDGQLDDVKSSRRELAKVIRSVEAEIVDVFVAAFADVSANFSTLFSLLFPGGQGSLELTDPSHPLETGIRVRARPSGKNVRSISLLSGGERSLTALAYLFAVFRSRPSPFYILDEVEAALDDVNLHRFLELVGEFRREAQLLIVSHQQRTMATADVLYGVTMAPGGASGVVSERMATFG